MKDNYRLLQKSHRKSFINISFVLELSSEVLISAMSDKNTQNFNNVFHFELWYFFGSSASYICVCVCVYTIIDDFKKNQQLNHVKCNVNSAYLHLLCILLLHLI